MAASASPVLLSVVAGSGHNPFDQTPVWAHSSIVPIPTVALGGPLRSPSPVVSSSPSSAVPALHQRLLKRC